MRTGLARGLATVGGLGDRLPAPGTTVGSLLAVVVFFILLRVAGPVAMPAAVTVLIALLPVAVVACGAEAARRGVGDPGAVVLDEVAGQWLAHTIVLVAGGAPLSAGGLALSFLLFRAFDVVKPWPIRMLEGLPGGWGIVADDLAAGIAAAASQVAVGALIRTHV